MTDAEPGEHSDGRNTGYPYRRLGLDRRLTRFRAAARGFSRCLPQDLRSDQR
jgi:hypothetical protein